MERRQLNCRCLRRQDSMKKKQLELGLLVPASSRFWRRDRKLPGSESCFADARKREAGRPASPRGVAARHSLAARGEAKPQALKVAC